MVRTAQPAAWHRRLLAAALPNLRLIIGIILLLLGLGNLSCQMEGSVGEGPVVTPAVQWVRTAHGWERPDRWKRTELHAPRLHPFVVAAGQGLFSVFGLVVCASDDRMRRRG